MGRRVIITEDSARRIAEFEILSEGKFDYILNSKEFKDAVKSAIKDDRDFDRNNEKKVKKIVSDCVSELFRSLWQRNSIWTSAIKNS